MAFEAHLGFSGTTATLHLAGDLEERNVPLLRSLIEKAAGRPLQRLVLYVSELGTLAGGGVRCLAFAQQHMRPGTQFIIDGANEPVREALRLGGLDRSMTVTEEHPVLSS
ncbi:STAS domain-containing protein [Kitasatospora sp. NPDC052896]|uniref:STAS domain-containing protein n=1 Tax=Kitasatospora sp. NPDC052896 TaxID=3364061 RepID=UPI0037C75CA8